MKRIVALLFAFVLVLASFTGCGQKESAGETAADTAAADAAADTGKESDAIYRTLDEIKESGKIVIGVFSDKNPFGYVDENGEYQGYDVYFAKRLAEDLGVEVEFVSTEAANRVEYLETGKVDVILANLNILNFITIWSMSS